MAVVSHAPSESASEMNDTYKGPYLATKYFLPNLKQSVGPGKVANISSDFGCISCKSFILPESVAMSW
jgi:hypothetical protein